MDDVFFGCGGGEHAAEVWVCQVGEHLGEVVSCAEQGNGFTHTLSLREHAEIDALELRCDRLGIVNEKPEEVTEYLAANPWPIVLDPSSSVVDGVRAPDGLSKCRFGNL